MGGDQVSRVNIERNYLMSRWDFKLWGDGWKCFHCNFRVDWSITKAKNHFKGKHNK